MLVTQKLAAILKVRGGIYEKSKFGTDLFIVTFQAMYEYCWLVDVLFCLFCKIPAALVPKQPQGFAFFKKCFHWS